MLSSSRVLAPDTKMFTAEFSSTIRIHSVASVTSVRCSPLRVVLARDPKVLTAALSSLIFKLDPEMASFDEEREPRCRGF
jgi:hypothetical protein